MNNSQKALAITLLIVCTIALSVVNIEFYKHNTQVAEVLIDIKHEAIIEKPEDIQNDNSPKTNKGYNETKKYKHFAQAYKPIAPPKDFEDPRLNDIQNETYDIKKASKNTADASVQNEELTALKSVNSILNKRSNAVKNSNSQASANKNSSIVYSLKDRTDTYLPIPIYLCEANGKIVVNITVNAGGNVIKTSINTASNSNNKCLQQHALEYAKETQFNTASKQAQIGTITFNFEGK